MTNPDPPYPPHPPVPPEPPVWKTSTKCDTGSCILIGVDTDQVLIRDSKEPDGPILSFTINEWRAFVAGVRDGEFDV